MFTVIYDADNGFCLQDRKVEDYVMKTLIDNPNGAVIRVGSHLIINAFRVAVLTNQLAAADIKFEFNGQIITINDAGKLSHWPQGFCDIIDSQLDTLFLGR